MARRSASECTFEVADACDLPFEDGSFDVTACMATLEFIPEPAAAVREMARCTKSGGHILVGTLNRLSPLNRRRVAKGKLPYASAHLFSPEELRDLLVPWGTVRMSASSPRGRKGRTLLPMRIVSQLPALQKRLRGPFIVAEVQL